MKENITKTYWLSEVPKSCDICHNSITTVFIDGATTFGPWANMCVSCHDLYGVGLGIGKGQKYQKQSDGRFLKISK
jgi:hypothetical protein